MGRIHPANSTNKWPDNNAEPNTQQPAATKPPAGIFEPPIIS
jgi:hypothetical protein